MSQRDQAAPSPDKEGFLEKRAGTTKNLNENLTSGRWNKYYFQLLGGTIYYFEGKKAKKARGLVRLKDCTVEAIKAKVTDDVKNHCFVIHLPENIKFVAAATNDEEAEEWVAAIQANIGKPQVNLAVGSKDVLFSAKKNVAGRIATSAMGKKAIKKVIPERQRNLIAAVKRLIEHYYGDRTIATRMERNCIKIVLKTYFQWQNKNIPLRDLVALDKPLRRALTLLYKLRTGLNDLVGDDEALRKQTLEEKLCIISYLLEQVHSGLSDLLKPHLQLKNLNKMDELFENIARYEFLFTVYEDSRVKEDMEIVMTEVKWYIDH